MKAPHKIENELFFLFLRQKLSVPKDLSTALMSAQITLKNVVPNVENDRDCVPKIVAALKEEVRAALLPSASNVKREE